MIDVVNITDKNYVVKEDFENKVLKLPTWIFQQPPPAIWILLGDLRNIPHKLRRFVRYRISALSSCTFAS